LGGVAITVFCRGASVPRHYSECQNVTVNASPNSLFAFEQTLIEGKKKNCKPVVLVLLKIAGECKTISPTGSQE
jgi:hypothetical protein